MRLHRLTVTAFGPFADTVEVDFDALSEAGLFLLSGPTGAGKTSVLDAVCFALYGEVPGDRSSARRLRCDVAPPGVPPRVELEASLGGRRFRIVRSPAWRRPKRRGEGETTEQARVTLVELVDGSDVHLTSRLDEAGHLVTELLGMTLAQFSQVALLPQGRFQDFLRARSEDRHALLQQLFRTRRFGEVERWLRDRRTEARRAVETQAHEVTALIHRLGEAAGEPGREPEEELDEQAVRCWLRDCRDDARVTAERARAAREAAQRRAGSASAAYDDGLALAHQQQRHAAAVAELARLDASAPGVERRRTAVERARRALPVTTLDPRLQSAQARLERATVGQDPALDLDDARRRAREADRRLAEARSLLPRDRERAGLTHRLSELRRRHRGAREVAARRRDAQSALPTAVTLARDRLAEALAATVTATEQQERVDRLIDRLAARDRAAQARLDLRSARRQHQEAVDQQQRLREVWLDLRELRLSGMAAEIAQALVVGGSCPVCGSCDHPHPAMPDTRATDAGAERAARVAAESADVERLASVEIVHAVQARLLTAETLAGDCSELGERLDAARSRLSAAAARADDVATARAAVDRLEQESSDAGRLLAEAEEGVAVSAAELREVTERLAEVEAALCADLAGHPTLDALIDLRGHEADAAHRRLAATEEHVAATADVRRLRGEAEMLARQAGFTDAATARSSGLEPAALRGAEAEVAQHDVERQAAAAQALAPDLAAAARCPTPDVAALGRSRDETAGALAAALALDQQAARRQARVDQLSAELTTAVHTWAPLRREHAVVAELAAFAEGKASDNRLQMRLSAYVLSWRLGQVVAAANARLARMTDQRYALEHTSQRGAGESRGGLSLVVRDAWSGEARDPVTLSGGETFVVSLALALGLTDVVSGEAGGAEVGTLFVDEGFGSLDAETLDDVMDTLDELRDGGRVVGVVSHVAEMRDRIPTRLQISKARRGSTVALERTEAW